MSDKYPWYEIVEGEMLEQGDILLQCPIFVPTPDFTLPLPKDDIPIDIRTFDVVVMTQSCDLVNDKISDVILCPHFDLTHDAALATKKAQEEIIKGYRHRYTMLAPASLELSMGVRIVDFGRIFSLPKVFVCQFATGQGKRLRLCPPYREHLSQSFARFFMRVGLPQNIELPDKTS